MWLVSDFFHLVGGDDGNNSHYSLGGDDGIRTHDPLLAGQVLSQLSYTPINEVCLLHFYLLTYGDHSP